MIFPQSVKIGELLNAFYIKLGIDDKNTIYFLTQKYFHKMIILVYMKQILRILVELPYVQKMM